MNQSIATPSVLENPSPMRTSEVLRGILSNNPGVEDFTIRRILRSIGKDRVDLSLIVLALPAIIPVPAPRGVVAVPATALGYQMLSGQQELKLPRFILKKSVSRHSLSVAIHSVLPLLEAAEKAIRPRWAWVSHHASQRVLGLFVLLLALAIGFPLLGLTPLHATSIFVIALGMAEKDGLAVLLGVVTGLLAPAFALSSGASARALRSQGVRCEQPQLNNLIRLRPAKSRALRLTEPRETIEGARVLRIDQRRPRVRKQPSLQTGGASE